MFNQKNTFISLVEQVALLNKNAVEIMTALNDVVTDRNSSVDVNMVNEDGTITTYYLPTVGQLKSEIELANSNIERLAGLVDNNVYISDGTTTRKVYVDDLNREPEPINDLNKVSKFVSINNSFFEALSNPILAVNIDLTGRIDRKVNKVLSRRYIVKFLKDDDGNLTEDGAISQKDFTEKFLNNNNIYIDDFVTWYDNTDNNGLLRANEPYDEQVFSLDYDELEYYGVFDVLGVDNDTINNKMWYILGTLTYYDINGDTRQLSVSDELIINKKNSATKWIVKEVSTAKSNYRVILERVNGLDPVPILNQGLKIYSKEVSNKSIKVSIGFDEYNLIFIKPINTDANIISTTWSYGTSFYTNDLVLDSNNKVSMNKYYSETVFDYGTMLKDMIVKNIPSVYGKIPNIPELLSDNFKVLQINKHLTESTDTRKVKELHSQKTSVKSKLEQINEAIIDKTREVNVTSYRSNADKASARATLNVLVAEQETQTKLYSSLVSQISTTGSEVKESPKYRIRGFWSFPEPILTAVEGYQKKQEVVQFEVQYRYSSKGGVEPATEGFSLNIKQTQYVAKTSTSSSAAKQRTAFDNPDVVTTDVNTTGYFSNWTSLKSDVRKRKYNKTLDVWTWEIEDVTDADTPNINQLDIPIQTNEKVEIRVRSISEVGYPDAPIYSDWSQILTVEFPDDLKDVGDENDLILRESQNEELYSQLEAKFNSKGLTTHLQQSFWNNDEYIAHMDRNLGTTFKDSNGNMINLYDYLTLLTNRIKALEEQISKAKGELVVKLFKNGEETVIANGAAVNVSIIAEDYAQTTSASTRTYYNQIYSIDDYLVQFENIAQSNELGLLSYRNFVPETGINNFYNPTKSHGSLATYVDSQNILHAQIDNQFIYIQDTSNGVNIYHSGNTGSDWNNVTYDGGSVLESNYNVGISGFTTGGVLVEQSDGRYADPLPLLAVPDNGVGIYWSGNTNLLCTVHPYFEDITQFVYSEKSGERLMSPQEKIIVPIKIFFQLSKYFIMPPFADVPPNGTGVETVTMSTLASSSISLIKKLRFFIEPANSNRPFEFEIIFRIYRQRTYNIKVNTANPIGGGTSS